MRRSSLSFLMALGFALAGCSSSDTSPITDDSGSDSSLQNDATRADTGGGDGSSADSADGSLSDSTDAADTGNDDADAAAPCVPTCPTCTAPQVCCAQRCTNGGTGVMAMCSDPGMCVGLGAITCRGPQDCASGQICCGSGTNTSPLDTMCVTGTSCASRQLIVCRTVADCPPPANAACSSGSSTGGQYHTCREAKDAGLTDAGDGGDGGGLPDGAEVGAAPSDGGDAATLSDAASSG